MLRIVCYLFILLVFGCSLRKERADLIVHNAVIYTLNPAQPTVEALVVKDGKIVETGAERRIMNRYQSTVIIDGKKNYVYPGFTYHEYREASMVEVTDIFSVGATEYVVFLPDAALNMEASNLPGFAIRYRSPVSLGKNTSRSGTYYSCEKALDQFVWNTGTGTHVEICSDNTALLLDSLLTPITEETPDHRLGIHLRQSFFGNVNRLKEKYVIPFVSKGILSDTAQISVSGFSMIIPVRDSPLALFTAMFQSGFSPDESLKSITVWPSIAHFAEEERGTLEPGKAGNFTMLNTDILKSPDEAANARIIYTVREGEIMHGMSPKSSNR